MRTISSPALYWPAHLAPTTLGAHRPMKRGLVCPSESADIVRSIGVKFVYDSARSLLYELMRIDFIVARGCARCVSSWPEPRRAEFAQAGAGPGLLVVPVTLASFNQYFPLTSLFWLELNLWPLDTNNMHPRPLTAHQLISGALFTSQCRIGPNTAGANSRLALKT